MTDPNEIRPNQIEVVLPDPQPLAEDGQDLVIGQSPRLDALRARLNVPEKVGGLERLAEAGVNVPKHRYYMPAEFFAAEEIIPTVRPMLEALQVEVATGFNLAIKVRSAYPRESEFSGGAFETKNVQVKVGDTVEIIWGKICRARQEIIAEAQPAESLQIRRDIKFKGIEDFDPNQMSVFVNEDIVGFGDAVKFTVVPLDNDRVRLCFLSSGGYSNHLNSFDLGEETITEDLLRYNMGVKGLSVDVFRQAIEQAVAAFDMPQEMELFAGSRGVVFVQTKQVEPLKTNGDKIPDKLFDKGVRTYVAKDDGARFSDPYKQEPLRIVERSDRRAEVRDTQALILNEGEWLETADFGENKDFEPGYENDPFYGMRALLLEESDRGQELRDLLLEKYEELIRLAEEYSQYALVIPRLVISLYENDWNLSPKLLKLNDEERGKLKRIYTLRAQLMQNAAVQYRGYSSRDIGVQGASDAHYRFGVVGPRQIAIMFEGKMWKPKGAGEDRNRWRADRSPTPQDPVKNLKNGDRVLFMIKEKKKNARYNEPLVSVLPMTE